MKLKKFLIITLIGGLLLSGGFISAVNAEDGNETVNPPFTPQGKMGEYMQIYYHAQVAQLLNLSEDALYEARESGKSLAEIAVEQGVERVTLENKLLDLKKEALNQAVDDGIISQEQADFMLERMESRVSTMIERQEFGPNKSQDWAGGKGRGQRPNETNGFGRGYQQNTNDL